MSEDTVEVASSKLGTKEYWDSRYEMELCNFKDCGDEGEVWFGRSAENRIVKYMLDSKLSKDCPILDLGCGNGSVLRRLRDKGFTKLCGVDYCKSAIDLARNASANEEEEISIEYQVFDILDEKARAGLNHGYGCVLDKGTWDAMCLSDDRDERLAAYKATVTSALREDGSGILVIFSCNFTCAELRSLFEDSFRFLYEVPAAHAFSFGGGQGVTSTGAIFQLSSR